MGGGGGRRQLGFGAFSDGMWRLVVSLTLQTLYSRRKSPLCLLNMPMSQSWIVARKKITAPAAN
jgi:hypothetical protein